MHSNSWWHGSKWLITEEWPDNELINIDTSEMKMSAVHAFTRTTCNIMEDVSSFNKMLRIIAYCLRFKSDSLGIKQVSTLSVEELTNAEATLVRMVQGYCFAPEHHILE